MAKPTRLDYCQYLLSSPLNYTLTHFADHSDRFTHDMLNRYLGGDRVSPRVIWENAKPHLTSTAIGCRGRAEQIMTKRPRRLVIDADVVRSAGESEKPTWRMLPTRSVSRVGVETFRSFICSTPARRLVGW